MTQNQSSKGGRVPGPPLSPSDAPQETGDLGEILQESRLLSQPAQVLMAFLVIVPFSAGFTLVQGPTRWLYVGTFLSSLGALVLITAPASQHRIERPLRNRLQFKARATRTLIAGTALLTISLVLAAALVISVAVGEVDAAIGAGLVAILTIYTWWIVPLRLKMRGEE